MVDHLWVMGRTAVALHVCACDSYATMITLLSGLEALCAQDHCLQGNLTPR